MISLLQNSLSYVSKKVFGDAEATPVDALVDESKEPEAEKEDEDEEDVENLLDQIEEIRKDNVINDEPQLNYDDDEPGCIYAHGTVTLVHHTYVLIDNKYMCENRYIVPENVKVGDKVQFMAFKANRGEDLKVRKIISKVGLTWEGPKDEFEFDQKDDVVETVESKQPDASNDEPVKQNIHIVDKKQVIKRAHIGKVERRQGREVYLQDNTCINLDNIKAGFVPVVGDWLKLNCLVEVNESVPNFEGEILEIESMCPLRMKNTIGKITEYNESLQYGLLDKTIVFSKIVCMSGYCPCIGDRVVAQIIESEQGMQQHWRALSVVPVEDMPTKHETSTIKYEPRISAEELNSLLEDKENVEITNDLKVNLNVREEQSIEISIKNNGNFKQALLKCIIFARKSESQLLLEYPDNKEDVVLKPSMEVTCKFKCKAKFVGVSKELVIFKFQKFKVGRLIQIKVNSVNVDDEKSTFRVFNAHLNNCSSQSVMPQEFADGMYIRGIKPFKPAKFIPVRPVTWKIPNLLWTTIDSIIMEKKTRTEAQFIIAEKIPYLNQPLKFQNYKPRFDYLLYLEEIALILEMKKFNMDSAVMHRSGEYLTLCVPGLVEKRPSLIIGDRVIIYFKWQKDSKHYEGYIHKIKSSDIYLKFSPSFQDTYNGEDCEVSFKASTSVMQRCHAAIGAVVNSLGEDFLFPIKILQKEPQYNFVDEAEENEANNEEKQEMAELSSADARLKVIESILYKRKLKWINKKLNRYQKEAVKNVLKGLARPLPYVIFGPPGTGKTITVVEGILQIFYLITESRILIATPSNSSANLIAERLLDSGVLQPGDLVRLVAYHYLESDQVPEKLLPYCATADIAEEGTRSDLNMKDSRGCQQHVTLRTLCRHRIIIGTCTALGILYNMGCKPGHFTHVFVDEAGQASEPEIMIPLSLANSVSTQVILAGDPKQLGPITQSKLASYFGLNDSFLVRLLQQFPYQRDPLGFESGYDPRLVTKLLINYRSLPDLLALPNKLFYDSELISHIDPEESEEAELLEQLSDMLPQRIGAPPAIVFHCVNGTNMQDPDSPSWYNSEEATQIYIYLLELYNHGLEPEDIGIITPYSKQVHKIKSLLIQLDVELPKVGSVEEFQGQERKVILLSTVRTAEDKVKEDIRHSLGFVAARERLNVAITRARALLIIIGCHHLLQQDVYWRSVFEHCSARSSIIGRDSQ